MALFLKFLVITISFIKMVLLYQVAILKTKKKIILTIWLCFYNNCNINGFIEMVLLYQV